MFTLRPNICKPWLQLNYHKWLLYIEGKMEAYENQETRTTFSRDAGQPFQWSSFSGHILDFVSS